MLRYIETDGFNNQFIALRFACSLASFTNKTLIIPTFFSNHKEGIIKNEFRLRISKIIDKTSLTCNFLFFENLKEYYDKQFKECFNLKCVLNSPSNIILKNKVMYNMGLSRKFRNLIDIPELNFSPVIVNNSLKILQNERFDVIHIRQFSNLDYALGEKPHVKSRTTVAQYVGKIIRVMRPHIPLYVMTQECSFLKHIIFYNRSGVYCLNELKLLKNLNHGDLKCIYSQLIAVRASVFWGEEKSTVSQFVMRKRFGKDATIYCHKSWCWYH